MTDEREVIRQESFWFATTTLAFTGFVGALLKTPSYADAVIATALIFTLSIFTIYLLVGRHKRYRELNGETVPGWWTAFWRAAKDKSGTLYCVMLVAFAAIGFFLIILMRLMSRVTSS